MTLPRIEIGSGNSPAEGYLHADIDARMPDLTYVCGMDSIPVADASFSEVRSVHSIEHVSLSKARAAIAEWYRILAPGGTVYIDTPNIERNMLMYADGRWREDFAILTPEQQAVCSMDGQPNRALWLNFKVFSDDDSAAGWNLHRWNATPGLLRAMLTAAGFREIKVLADDPSLIVTGTKP
jgi:predicted SAM-dependent methyltransferase